MVRAIRFHRPGGPEVLQIDEIDVPAPGKGEVRLRQTASGVNFTDIYSRSGLYPAPMPMIPGREGVGVVEAVGPGVTGWSPGDRVAYCALHGSYAEARLIDPKHLIRLPDEIDDVTAASIVLRGITAHFLLHDVHPVKAGDTILVHAAAGGVGLILAQWATAMGVRVIGTASSEAKAALAREAGCAHVITGRDADIPGEVKAFTDGAMVGVVYDAVGRDTYVRSLDSLARRGHLVSFGQASGAIPPVTIQEFGNRGSLSLTRPMLGDYIADPAQRDVRAAALFDRVAAGRIKVRTEHVYPFERIGQAHEDLEAGRTSGSLVLTMT
ncbi:MAG: quinone oxidoreductase [Rhodobacteraceae bacterium]|nr:quinone oxidoreductase [Paracoccaceae bacterium]MBR27960.1 quinone oxidoreductase [Paracoccaceae bacterium]